MGLGSAILGVMLLGFFGFIALQLFMVLRMTRMRGKPAPELTGAAGKAVKRGRALFYFYSPQCGACRMMTPVIKDMKRGDDRVFPVDISRDMATARRFGVMATPTTILVQDGHIADVIVGARPEETLRGLMAA